MVRREVLEGVGKSINRRTKTAKKECDRFFIYIPVEVARDSAFPFRPEDRLIIKVEKGKNKITVEKLGKGQSSTVG
ncbi:MAG: hypothetical protein JRN12_03555 [Nitrososphaerota archaeon]|jgi:hypothetical protein|nr:hypothetical protein [Nitrososphaerota archaeon]MDG6950906.1 hypothetical protein [Nitrososphaerota archaeon]